MLKIGIIPNEDKDEELKYTRILVDSIKNAAERLLYAMILH